MLCPMVRVRMQADDAVFDMPVSRIMLNVKPYWMMPVVPTFPPVNPEVCGHEHGTIRSGVRGYKRGPRVGIQLPASYL